MRKAGLAGDAAEVDALFGAEGDAGAAGAALERVVVDERDVILARSLWRAAQATGPRPVVGVVGAGHVPGIKRLWLSAGEPEFAAKALEYEQMPPAAEELGARPVATAVGLFGVLAYAGVSAWRRRPRTAKSIAGLFGIWGAYSVQSSIDEMKRHGAACERVAATARAVENGTAERGGRGGEGRQ